MEFILQIVCVALVFGVLLWLVNSPVIPMLPPIRLVLNAVLVVIMILWLFGMIAPRGPHIRFSAHEKKRVPKASFVNVDEAIELERK